MKWQHKLLIAIAFAAVWAAPLAAQIPNEYNFKLTPQEVDTIGKWLGKGPYDEVAPLAQKLREQIIAQQRAVMPKQEAPVAPTPEAEHKHK